MTGPVVPTGASPYVALGVLSTTDNTGQARRERARNTWVPPLRQAGRVCLRFVIRAGDLKSRWRRQLAREMGGNGSASEMLQRPRLASANTYPRSGRSSGAAPPSPAVGIRIGIGTEELHDVGRSCHVSWVKHAQRRRSRGRISHADPCPPPSPRRRLLPVSSSAPRELDGRIASLLGWLRAAPVACPGALWIAKADDDTYIREDGWVAALHAIGAGRQQTGAPVVPRSRADSRDRHRDITVPGASRVSAVAGASWPF